MLSRNQPLAHIPVCVKGVEYELAYIYDIMLLFDIRMVNKC